MQKQLFFKLISIGFLTLLLLIPLGLIEGVIAARKHRQVEVEQTIAASSAGAQTLIGPVLLIQYTERVFTRTKDDKGKEQVTATDHDRRAIFTPASLDVKANATTGEKYKGLYKALLHTTKGRWRANFNVPANLGLSVDPSLIKVRDGFLVFGVSDPRGLLGRPTITWNGERREAGSGTYLSSAPNGLHANLGRWEAATAVNAEASVDLELLGTSSLAFAPVGQETSVTLQSPWPHPNFLGDFLPRDHSIGSEGFSARWGVTNFATNNDTLLRGDSAVGLFLREYAQDTLHAPRAGRGFDTFGVKFIEPVNVYLRAERAVKYGVLFVALTFAAFFLLEILKSLRIHALQYGLVGLALAVFFLLTISLSEHIAFGWAYFAASIACVGLLTFYIAHVLKSALRGVAFGALFGLLYTVLYGLLLSEDNALVLGSLLLFVALAAVMILTRKVDWYHLGSPEPEKA
jgi:inner membrane protein